MKSPCSEGAAQPETCSNRKTGSARSSRKVKDIASHHGGYLSKETLQKRCQNKLTLTLML